MQIGSANIKLRYILLFIWTIFCFWLIGTSEGGMSVVGLFLLIWGWVCHLIGQNAERKNRNYTTFFLLSFFFSPLIMGFAVAVMSNPDKK